MLSIKNSKLDLTGRQRKISCEFFNSGVNGMPLTGLIRGIVEVADDLTVKQNKNIM